MRIKESRLASADLDAIFDYGLTHHGTDAAVSYLDDIERCYRQLIDFPRSGRSDIDLGANVQSLACNSHRIYYELDGDTIVILRILHMAADAARWLE